MGLFSQPSVCRLLGVILAGEGGGGGGGSRK